MTWAISVAVFGVQIIWEISEGEDPAGCGAADAGAADVAEA
jgi:hypothetical protein